MLSAPLLWIERSTNMGQAEARQRKMAENACEIKEQAM